LAASSVNLLQRNDLRLLETRLTSLQHAPFFNEGVKEYLSKTRDVVSALQARIDSLDPGVTGLIGAQLWTATQYLSGSVSREVPYEVVYGLELALDDWMAGQSKHVVTTAFLAEQNYMFVGVDDDFYGLVEDELGVIYTQRLVQVALPQLYKHSPINNSVLYHELGHFVDWQFGISNMMLLLSSPRDSAEFFKNRRHFPEYFADLFAACYVGGSIGEMLEALAPGAVDSPTHPATGARVKAINEFLNGIDNPIVNLCNFALSGRSLPQLQVRSRLPCVGAAFDNMRPCAFSTKEEVHGVFEAALKYLKEKVLRPSGPWTHLGEGETTRVINDLVEKSIRNWMITERWSNDGAQ